MISRRRTGRKVLRTLRQPARESLRDWGAIGIPKGASLLTIAPIGGKARYWIYSAETANGFVGEVSLFTADEHYTDVADGATANVPLDPDCFNQVSLASDSEDAIISLSATGYMA